MEEGGGPSFSTLRAGGGFVGEGATCTGPSKVSAAAAAALSLRKKTTAAGCASAFQPTAVQQTPPPPIARVE